MGTPNSNGFHHFEQKLPETGQPQDFCPATHETSSRAGGVVITSTSISGFNGLVSGTIMEHLQETVALSNIYIYIII